MAGPKRPQDRIEISKVKENFINTLTTREKNYNKKQNTKNLTHGKVCIAAITSCTNTSNPAVLIMAGLVAKKQENWDYLFHLGLRHRLLLAVKLWKLT